MNDWTASTYYVWDTDDEIDFVRGLGFHRSANKAVLIEPPSAVRRVASWRRYLSLMRHRVAWGTFDPVIVRGVVEHMIIAALTPEAA